MSEILPRLGNKVILDEAASNVLPFLPLTPGTTPPPRPATPAAAVRR